MTIPEIKAKIVKLDEWLTMNPGHHGSHLVLNDKRVLQLQLKSAEAAEPTVNDFEVNNPEIVK